MGRMLRQAEKAAFEQWGRRHEKGIIRWHRFKMLAFPVSVAGILAVWGISQIHFPAWATSARFLIVGLLAVVAVVAVISLLRRLLFGSYRVPRMPRGLR